jgi:hypothetical protein
MYYSYVGIEYVATSFSPEGTDLVLKLLTRFAIKFFSYDSLNARKKRNDYRQATYKDNFSCVLNQEFVFFVQE